MGHITLETTCGKGLDAKVIDVGYLITDTLSPYNLILGWPTINALGEIISTMYQTLKYTLIDMRDSITRGD